MFFRMNRTQTGECGTLHAGVIYDASMQPKLAAEAKAYVKSGFADELSKNQFEQINQAAQSSGDSAANANEQAAEAKAAEEAAAAKAAEVAAAAKAAEDAGKKK